MEQNLKWGKELTLYEKTREAVLEVLADGKPRWKHSFPHEFWKRGFKTTSSALTKHLTKLCGEGKIRVIRLGSTYMGGDDSQYQIAVNVGS